MSKIIGLHCKIKRGVMDQKRAEMRWEELLEAAFLLEDVIDSRHSIDHKISSTFWVSRRGSLGAFYDKLMWFWYVKLRAKVYFVIFLLAMVMSLLVVLGEVTLFTNVANGVFEAVLGGQPDFYRTQIACLVPLLFITLVVYDSLFQLKITGFFGLFPR